MNDRQSLRWDLEWRTTALVALMLPVLVALGFWQLDRAGEKRTLLESFEARRLSPPVSLATALAAGTADDLRGLPVLLRGEFLADRYLLLDNRLRDGRFGHEVVAFFREESSGLIVAVNRGWVPADPARRSLPVVMPPADIGELRATLHTPTGKPFELGTGPARIDRWPQRVQNLDLGAVARGLGMPVDRFAPATARLDADSPAALVTGWPVVNIQPRKHTAYAVQWFAMAAVLLVFFLHRSTNLRDVLRSRSA